VPCGGALLQIGHSSLYCSVRISSDVCVGDDVGVGCERR